MTATALAPPSLESTSIRPFVADRRLVTLFFTDMAERFSFFGMLALLFLYAAAPQERGGLGMPTGTAGALFGLYMASIFLACLPGAWLGDRVLGPRRAMLYGAIGIAAGHYFLAVPARPTFFVGLLFIAAGSGLIKPSMPVMFNEFYPRASSAQREAVFSMFYLGVHVSGLVAPLVTGVLGERVNWHLGFGAAAITMTIGVLVFLRGMHTFGDAGSLPSRPATARQRRTAVRAAVVASAATAVLLGAAAITGHLSVGRVLGLVGLVTLVVPVLYSRAILRHRDLTPAERGRIRAFLPILLSSVLFWIMFSQHGSTFLQFADEHTDRSVLGWQVPASWFQSVSPLVVLFIAPLLAMLWLRLGERVHAPTKMAAGLACTASSFVVLLFASLAAADGDLVSPLWLLVALALHAFGELCIGPIGLSVTAEIAPHSIRQQVMGMWMLGGALGAGLGGGLAQLAAAVPPPAYFGLVTVLGMAGAGLLAGNAGRLHRRLSPAAGTDPAAEPAADPAVQPAVASPAAA